MEPVAICYDIYVSPSQTLSSEAMMELEYVFRGCGLPLRLHVVSDAKINEWFLNHAIETGLISEVVYDQHVPST